ncbi:hypothetical protein [Pectobacterium aroidearum]
MLGEYDIFSHCGWEDDPVQSREPTMLEAQIR